MGYWPYAVQVHKCTQRVRCDWLQVESARATLITRRVACEEYSGRLNAQYQQFMTDQMRQQQALLEHQQALAQQQQQRRQVRQCVCVQCVDIVWCVDTAWCVDMVDMVGTAL